MKRLALLLILAALPALAQESTGYVRLEWDAPIECQNDQPISACPIAGWQIRCGLTAETMVARRVSNPAARAVSYTGVPAGTYVCQAAAYVEDGQLGLWSNVVTKEAVMPVVKPALPKAPTLR
jgi:hypothetical protein